MPEYGTPFSGMSARDVAETITFYRDVIGLDASVDDNGMGVISLGGDHRVLVYPKGDGHEPASFTVLNLPVTDVGAAVQELAAQGVEFLRYEGMPQDDDGVMRGHGPDIAWFTDPSGNVVSVIDVG